MALEARHLIAASLWRKAAAKRLLLVLEEQVGLVSAAATPENILLAPDHNYTEATRHSVCKTLGFSGPSYPQAGLLRDLRSSQAFCPPVDNPG